MRALEKRGLDNKGFNTKTMIANPRKNSQFSNMLPCGEKE